LYINIHEAALVNYPAMDLRIDKASYSLSAAWYQMYSAIKPICKPLPKTPWRTIIVSDKATDILASHPILNLNDPS